MRRSTQKATGPRSYVLAVLITLLLTGSGLAAPGTALDRLACDEELAAAEASYQQGRYADAVDRVTACFIRSAVDAATAARGYRLLVRVHLSQQDRQAARLAAIRLLAVDYAYEPDPVQDAPSYTQFITEVKQELAVPGRCPDELMAAEVAYEQGTFEETVYRIETCFGYGPVAPDVAVRGNRLLALAHLQQGDLRAAKQAILQLFEQAPDFRPDPVQDPPLFSALIEVILQQLPRSDDGRP